MITSHVTMTGFSLEFFCHALIRMKWYSKIALTAGIIGRETYVRVKYKLQIIIREVFRKINIYQDYKFLQHIFISKIRKKFRS